MFTPAAACHNPTTTQNILKVDPSSGLVEFPEPGDTKKHLLPILIDPEEAVQVQQNAVVKEETGPDKKEFWMPDRFCKVCYGCEDAFTMYRRRHHCRMCGQVFCNQCSSFYIDGSLINLSGPVRACRLCHDQIFERTGPQSTKINPLRRVARETVEEMTAKQVDSIGISTRFGYIHETPTLKMFYTNNLQKRASEHLDAMVSRLVSNCDVISDSALWSSIIVHLVREVVSSVDPNVRAGDSLDIRPYVKIKTIPGGSIEENCYINGVVFRKNVSHKKMAADGNKTNPRILILSGSIDFQRTDNRLASMDTLIEQEDKYIELLIDKIMSLKPDIILVGKAVARRAQELLCSHNVVVMQNVKPQLLERMSRMTGAIMLQSTDHTIQQYGEECLGTCGQFRLRLVQDNPDKSQQNKNPARVLRTRISRGSTYAYFQGCPSERGCTLVLRGAEKKVLAEVKKIISFSVMLAYHLRLEVAYYNDRFAQLPNTVDLTSGNDDSDVEDEGGSVLSTELRDAINSWYNRKSAISVNGIIKENGCQLEGSENSSSLSNAETNDAELKEKVHREARLLLSSSLDVDYGLAYNNEIRGIPYHHSKAQLAKVSCLEHQSLLVTSLLMGDEAQKSKPEVKGIRFYTTQDVALGQFLIENCFQLHKIAVRESSMVDHILSFAHRNSRLDIVVKKVGNSTAVQFEDGVFVSREPMTLPILMHSFCKECNQVVTPEIVMSDETWKISFGKFMEILFYNRSALGRTSGCSHCVHESHALIFACEGYEARFDLVPLHPFSLHIRTSLGEFPTDMHAYHAASLLTQLPVNIIEMVDLFLRTIVTLENIARDVMIQRNEEFQFICSDFRDLEAEIKTTTNSLIEDICKAAEWLSANGGSRVSTRLGSNRSSRNVPISPSESTVVSRAASASSTSSTSTAAKAIQETAANNSDVTNEINDIAVNDSLLPSAAVANALAENEEAACPNSAEGDSTSGTVTVAHLVGTNSTTSANGGSDERASIVAVAVEASDASIVPDTDLVRFNYPMYFKREAYLKARQWNNKLEMAYRHIEQVRQEMLLALQQQQTGTPMPNMAALQITPLHGISEVPGAEQDELEGGDEAGNSSSNSSTRMDPVKRSTSVAFRGSSQPPQSPTTSSPARQTREDSASIPEMENLPPPVSSHSPPRSTGRSSPPTVPRDADVAIKASEPAVDGSATDDSDAFGLDRTTSSIVNRNSAIISQESIQDLNSHPNDATVGTSSKKIRPVSTTISARNIVDNNNSSGKGTAKSSSTYRLPKALARLMLGKDADADDTKAKSLVPLGVMEEGRLGLKPGRRGEVIALHEEEPATVIAYSLASEEYYKELQKFFGSGEADSAEASEANVTLLNPHSSAIGESNKSSLGPFASTKEDNLSNKMTVRDMDNELDNDYANDNLGGVDDSTKQVGQAFPNNNDTGDYNTNFNSFSTGSILFGNASNLPVAEPATPVINLEKPESSDGIQPSTSILPGVAPLPSSVAVGYAVPTNSNNTSAQKTSNELEKQMTSQRKFHVRHSFEDIDEKGHVLCKFLCTSYWAGQFEAIRAGYLKEEENIGFLKSLSMSSRWGAQGGKSGANFSKSLDERFILKVISKVELQMFLDFAPAYFGENRNFQLLTYIYYYLFFVRSLHFIFDDIFIYFEGINFNNLLNLRQFIVIFLLLFFKIDFVESFIHIDCFDILINC